MYNKITAVAAFVAGTSLALPLPAQNLGLKLSNSAKTPLYVEVPYSKTLHPQTGITVESWITYDESTLGASWNWPTIDSVMTLGSCAST